MSRIRFQGTILGVGKCVLLLWLALHGFETCRANEPVAKLAETLRRPVALCLTADDSKLITANRDSGSISIVDCKTRSVIKEATIGKRLSHLAALDDGQRLFVTDEASHDLLVVDASTDSPNVVGRVAVAPFPVSIVADAVTQRAFVASLWSRQITVVDVADAAAPKLVTKIDLPFAPRNQVLVREARYLVVADSFAGRFAVIDAATLAIATEHTFPAHNIRGLGVSADGQMLLVSHQMLNELANTIRNDVHWGLLMSNDLRWFKLDSVLDTNIPLFNGAHMHPLGEAGRATADPQDLTIASNGTVIVTMGGVGEIAFGKERDFSLQRLKVGHHPVDVVVTRDSQVVYVANMFDDSISVVSLADRQVIGNISLGPQRELTVAEQGELLFHDGRLSHDGWMTCNSCHSDGHTNSFQNDNLSDQGFGAPKRVLSLLGVRDTAPYAWNGGVARLEDQIRNSIEKTMQSADDARPADVKAIAAFVRTFESPPAVDFLRGRQDPLAIARGQQLFGKLQCNTCHAPPLYTTPDTYDVGLKDREGNRQYNPPSLRGLSQRGPYLHDDQTEKYDEPPRAARLEDVFVIFRHQLERDLSEQELSDLLSFLRSL